MAHAVAGGMVGAARGNENEAPCAAACWQLGDIRDDERAGLIFRICADHRREPVAQLEIECRVDEAKRGRHHLVSDLAAIARCLGLAATNGRGIADTPVTVTLEGAALERPVRPLDAVVRLQVGSLALDPGARYFVVCARYLGRALSVALPGQEMLRVALPRPKCLAFQVAEIRRTRAGIELSPVDEVLSWWRDSGAVQR